MRFRAFQYPLPLTTGMEDLNAMLEAHPAALVSHHVVVTGGAALLLFVVDVLSRSPGGARESAGDPRVDYREVLDMEQFALFSRLRRARKAWAEAEGVPVYTVFTNAQLAEIVRLAVRTPEELGKVDGLGSGRIERYGARLLEVLNGRDQPAGSP